MFEFEVMELKGAVVLTGQFSGLFARTYIYCHSFILVVIHLKWFFNCASFGVGVSQYRAALCVTTPLVDKLAADPSRLVPQCCK